MGAIQNRYDDFTIISRIIFVMKLINQVKQHDNQRAINIELELALLQTMCMFKSSVLGDPRILLLASQAKEEINNQKDVELGKQKSAEETAYSYYAKTSCETRDNYNSVAQMMDNTDMQAVMTIFAEKMLTNLVFSKHDEEDSRRLVTVSLEVF